jgi:prepilin-type N-terminal cleavage/methylation domain-containing protein
MHPDDPKRGFTLIELLVVIAIIAILAAILFPVFAKAREKARQSSCLSNTKQMGLAFLQYAQDYDETFPGVRFGTGGAWPWTVWDDPRGGWTRVFYVAVAPYIKSEQIYQCPSDSGTGHRWYDGDGMSYGYNEYLYNYNGGFCKLAEVSGQQASVTDIALVAETWASGIFMDWETGGPNPDGMDRIRYTSYNPWRNRHEVTNIVYVDGHSKAVPLGKFSSTWPGGSPYKQFPVVNPRMTTP